ncbi:MAG: nucleoside triphosphate pyrophosphohydrolase [Anaerolineae bacterium]|nr:nucleoside triphosphate pyrophosphohydrolase [Anaerolineae bacterium]
MDEQVAGGITIVGLGPGGSSLLTQEAWQLLHDVDEVYLRTSRHPAATDLPEHLRVESFDSVYDSATEFAAVYEEITGKVLRLGRRPEGVVYAVPGHPHIAEATVTSISEAARAAGIPLRIVPGLSFVEPALTALGIDGLNGLQLFDAITVAAYTHPPLSPDAPVLLGQVYNRLLAGELKLALMAIYPDEHPIVLVHAAGTPEERLERLALFELDRSAAIDHLTSLFIPPLPLPSSLDALAEAVAVLRGPGGCPWDQEQTPQSLRAGFLEETAELLAALDSEDVDNLREELGDVLLHIVMQTQMAREEELFRLSEVIGDIHAKIKRRHPHVWGDWEVAHSEEVVANWEAIKVQEKKVESGRPPSILDNIPAALPALARSQKVQERVRKVGFDWPALDGVVAKLDEEIAELRGARSARAQRAEMGDLLFAAVNWARWLGIDAEAALREANLRFDRRFRRLEALADVRGISLEDATIEALEVLWQEVKEGEI